MGINGILEEMYTTLEVEKVKEVMIYFHRDSVKDSLLEAINEEEKLSEWTEPIPRLSG